MLDGGFGPRGRVPDIRSRPCAQLATAVPAREEVFEAVLYVRRSAWKSTNTENTWSQRMRFCVWPHTGSRGADTLATSDVPGVLALLPNEEPPTAKRALQRGHGRARAECMGVDEYWLKNTPAECLRGCVTRWNLADYTSSRHMYPGLSHPPKLASGTAVRPCTYEPTASM